ncbi:hypothetical protein BDC45DRAFT_503183 [Circinella umbellata]|nr:hypothetical protein BDC45DRAFT_503183 [Circinella umbellata]
MRRNICLSNRFFWYFEAVHVNGGQHLLGLTKCSKAKKKAFEVCALLTGALGKTNLASQSIIFSINSLFLMVSSALSNAVAVRIGHHAGANRPAKIQTCFTLASLMGIIAVTLRPSAAVVVTNC